VCEDPGMGSDATAQPVGTAQRIGTVQPIGTAQRIGSVRLPKLPTVVADALRRRILSGTLRQGDSLPLEQELSAQLGVSRPTLREALRVLEAESLIRPRRGSRAGAEVTAPTVDSAARYVGYLLQYQGTTLEDLARTRLMLEPPLAGQLAATRDPAVLARLRDALEQEEAAIAAPGEFQPAQARFHQLVCDLAGIETMAIFVRQLNWVLTRLTEEHRAASHRDRRRQATKAHRAHARLYALVEAGDAAAAQQFWHQHVAEVDKQLLSGREGQRVVDLFS